MITPKDIASRSFRMLRGDGSVVARSVFMLPDGRLFGTHHANETYWAIVGDTLEFLDEQRNVTSRFTYITWDMAGWRLYGLFIHGGGEEIRHILEESTCPIYPGAFDRSPVGNSVAVMLRTHFIDDSVLELVSHLDRGRQNFDLYLTIDETNGRPETDLQNVIWHSIARCPELGLTQAPDRLIWWCGDFPFYFALEQIPQYQYYAMLEYDVHLTQCDASLLNDLAAALVSGEAGRIDAVGTRLSRENPHVNHPLFRSSFAFFETTYSYFFPFIVLSKPAVSHLFAQRQLEALRETPAGEVLHCESFVPSHLIRAGFSVVDLNAVLPGSYRNDLMILTGRQHGLPRSFADGFEGFTRMIHPVYGDWDFMWRIMGPTVEEEKRRIFRKRMENGEFDLIPEPLRARFRAEVVG